MAALSNASLQDSSTSHFGVVVVIVGPTASGKSELAQLVAQRLGGEVVSADSMQIYRGMDIGTAKLLPHERRVPHHMIDVCEPGQAYSAQLFQEQARSLFSEINGRNAVPILAGGTGLYVQAALEDMRFPKGEQVENPIRQKWEAYLSERGAQALWDQLELQDAESAALIHPNNSRRVIRALEMCEQGVSYAKQSSRIKQLPEVVPSIRFGISCERAVLHKRIDERVDAMINDGLVDEVQGLLRAGFHDALTAMQAIGYKEIVAYLDGECSLNDAIGQIKLATRHYAKRQQSWFKRDARIEWLDSSTLCVSDMSDRIVGRYHEQKHMGLA